MLIPLMEIIMELLPNSKCLTKIKIPSQLGLIRELIGLPPVGKQWGLVRAGTETAYFPIAFSANPYVVLGVEYTSSPINMNSFSPKSTTATSVTYYNTEREKRYVAFGK